LAGRSQELLGGDERGDIMLSPPVVNRLLLPRFVPIKGSEPHPLSGWLRDVDVGEVLQSLSSKTSHVINEDCVIGVILRGCECQGPLLDLQAEQAKSVGCLNVILVLVVDPHHQLLAVSR